MKKIHPFLLYILGGTILGLAWIPNLTLLAFIGWVPFLWAAQNVRERISEDNKPRAHIYYPYLAFLIWNLISTWWVTYASLGGALLAIFANALLMSIAFSIYVKLNKTLSEEKRVWMLIPVWMAFEYFHHNWEGTWPWLSLGNVFAFQRNWIQWYEYTGTSGGTLWILLTNVLIFQFSQNFSNYDKTQLRASLSKLSVIIFFPIMISYMLLFTFDTKPEASLNALIIQPNIDPYNEKFDLDPSIQLNQLKTYLSDKIDSSTELLLLPETFLTENIWENDLLKSNSVLFLKNEIQKKYPKLNILTGANTLYAYSPGETPPITARPFDGSFNEYYDYFNTALFIPSRGNLQVYHKSKLVPGVERMPYPILFKPLEELALDMGGTTGSLGIQETRENFSLPDKNIVCAPIICYESIFGDYVGDYIRKGANLICIITNDGWWDDTPGHKHHLAYGALRAIEFRKTIVRSANTGISAIINPKGEITESRGWWQKDYIKQNVSIYNANTLYSKVGDYLSVIACFIMLFTVIISVIRRFKKA